MIADEPPGQPEVPILDGTARLFNTILHHEARTRKNKQLFPIFWEALCAKLTVNANPFWIRHLFAPYESPIRL